MTAPATGATPRPAVGPALRLRARLTGRGRRRAVAYSVSSRATMRLRLERARPGRRLRWRRVGHTVRRTVLGGSGRLRLPRLLASGRYRAVLVARDASGIGAARRVVIRFVVRT